MSYKKYNWELIAVDYNSSLFRHYIAIKGLFKYPKEIGIDKILVAMAAKNDDLEYATDLKDWQKVHIQLKEKISNNPDLVEDLIDRSHSEGERFNQWAKENIFDVDLSKKTGKELMGLLDKFADWQGLLYTIGTSLVVLDFGNFNYVEGFLNYYLKEKCSKEEQDKYHAIFTEPIANSFAQDQEEGLLRIISKNYSDKQWLEDVKKKELKDIKNKHSKFYKDLERHTEKHAWVYYSYNGPESKLEDFFDFIKDYLVKNEHPDKILEKLNKKKAEIVKEKNDFFKKYQPNEHEKKMLHLSGKLLWGKPRRKDFQSKAYYYVRKLQLEIARRLNLSLDQVRSTPFDMMYDALVNNKEVDTKIINSIRKIHVVVPNDNDTVNILTGKEAEEFHKNIKRISSNNYDDIKEIAGSIAFRGKVEGIVKIINTPSDMSKMEYGDILVSAQTSPSIISAMKKASAFVTDEGGLTCHAAIVSREMNTPCVVGTKIASHVLKDGDRVEVDAEKGIVRKLV